MAARSRAQPSAARASACCTKAAYNSLQDESVSPRRPDMSILGMVWRNDFPKICLIIARRAVCQTQFKIARRKLRRESTRPKIGCVNGDNCRAVVSRHFIPAFHRNALQYFLRTLSDDALTRDNAPRYSALVDVFARSGAG